MHERIHTAHLRHTRRVAVVHQALHRVVRRDLGSALGEGARSRGAKNVGLCTWRHERHERRIARAHECRRTQERKLNHNPHEPTHASDKHRSPAARVV